MSTATEMEAGEAGFVLCELEWVQQHVGDEQPHECPLLPPRREHGEEGRADGALVGLERTQEVRAQVRVRDRERTAAPSRELPLGVRLDGREVAHDDRGEGPRGAAGVGHRAIVGAEAGRRRRLSLAGLAGPLRTLPTGRRQTDI